MTQPDETSEDSYANRFQSRENAASYETAEYHRSSYSAFIWELQKPFVARIIEAQKAKTSPLRVLDFACGTGRVTSFLEGYADGIDAIDISEKMVEIARQKCGATKFVVGDICGDEGLLNKQYDVITVFRFFLNAEPELRHRILKALRLRMSPDGLLLVNIQGSSRSLRHPLIVLNRWRKQWDPSYGKNIMLAEMTPVEIERLFRESGFRIGERYGFGIFPQVVYHTPFRFLAAWIDRLSAGAKWSRHISIDLLLMCRIDSLPN